VLRLIAWEPGTYTLVTASGKKKDVVVQTAAPLAVNGAWAVRFGKQRGAPETITLDALGSWTDQADEGVKYFSGTATYVKDVEIPEALIGADHPLVLHLGTVKNLARVRLNGQDLGVLWKAPFEVDVSGAARAGANHLEIEVTNLWPNRLIGDARVAENKRVTWTTYNPYKADSPLLASGLLGPVTIRCGSRVGVKFD
jgi:hypothetical protein